MIVYPSILYTVSVYTVFCIEWLPPVYNLLYYIQYQYIQYTVMSVYPNIQYTVSVYTIYFIECLPPVNNTFYSIQPLYSSYSILYWAYITSFTLLLYYLYSIYQYKHYTIYKLYSLYYPSQTSSWAQLTPLTTHQLPATISISVISCTVSDSPEQMKIKNVLKCARTVKNHPPQKKLLKWVSSQTDFWIYRASHIILVYLQALTLQ